MSRPEHRITPAQRSDRAASAVAMMILSGFVGAVVQLVPGGGDFYTGFTFCALTWTVLAVVGALRSDR